MRIASIEVTADCNLSCPYCSRPRLGAYMDRSVFLGILSRCKQEGYDAVALGGGEPLLHPEVRFFVRTAAQEGFSVTLTTNATLPDMIPSLAGLSSLSVSAGKGSWREVLEEAGRYPFPVTANVLLVKGGMDAVKAYAADALRAGCERFLFLSYKGRDPHFCPSDEELVRLVAFCELLRLRFGVAAALDAYTLRRLALLDDCRKGFTRYDVSGGMQPCCFPDCEYYRGDEGRASSP